MPSTPSPPLKRVSQPQRMDSKLDNIPKSIPLHDDLGDGSHYSMEEFKQDATKWLKAMSLFIGVFAVYFGRFLMTPALNTDLKKGGLGPMVSIGEERVKWLNARNKGLDDFLVKDPLRIFLIWTTPPETFTVRNFKVIDAYFYHHPMHKLTLSQTILNRRYSQHTLRQGIISMSSDPMTLF
ncbi:hypothetical protein BC829DRAFT_169908 [Chytridium lagenaria]|nr:hypothetical protein BC829DRAFT_169908 [Chytridium lagenaria]